MRDKLILGDKAEYIKNICDIKDENLKNSLLENVKEGFYKYHVEKEK
jgi:hypothetical protein